MKHYVTFGQGHAHHVDGKTLDHNCVAVYESASPSEGRERAFELFGPKFSMEYHAEEWNEEDLHFFPRGYVELKTRIIKQVNRFEVYHKDIGQLNWKDAIETCKKLGEGWRLPTRYELLLMYKNKDNISGFMNLGYWSSTDVDDDYAWAQYSGGSQNNIDKDTTLYVRPIIDIN